MTSVISDLASNALTSLGSSALQKVAAAWHFKSDLLKLTNTITIIRDALVAHESQRQRHGFENLIERLEDAVHEADDLLDEFTTFLERKKLMVTHGRFMKEVRIFFSRENQVTTAFTISREMKRIRKTLDDIVRDNDQFASMLPPSMLPTREAGEQFGLQDKREETCSFIDDHDVIGRDDEKRRILDVLLRNDHHDTRMDMVVILPIIGIGGLGKTTIAQLVFNDENVKSHFELQKWICVGDDLGLNLIIRRIILSFSSCCSDDMSLEYMHRQLREKIGGKKYLLVLDDVWEEDPRVLLRLKELLAIGGKGSVLLVTTRSMYTAKRIGTVSPMELQGLSDDASWILFEKVTCMSEEHKKDEHLLQIGKAIVKKCANLPLAIKVVGSMLRGEDEKEWRYFKDHDLAKIDNDGGVIPLLKLSYYRLSSQLKHCFAYCSLFPKDHVMDKLQLCQLWVAQGFITSQNGSLEDVTERCFMGLLNRCFFQDVERNQWGEIEYFKMHDLIHDLAKDVTGKEFLLVDGSGNHDSSIKCVRHLSVTNLSLMPSTLSSSSQGGNHLRTFLRFGYGIPDGWDARNLISSFQCIKVLDLQSQQLCKLPDSIGKLIHIRYLDLSGNRFEMLPKSITRLHNLQTLNLQGCYKLKELPWGLNKLVNLQNLDLMFCDGLGYMPSGMDNLTCLQRLTRFVVGENKSASTDHTNGLGDLILLNSLRGSLEIDIRRKAASNSIIPITKKASCLLNKDSLTSLMIRWSNWDEPVVDDSHGEQLLESLQPSRHLKCFRLRQYGGQKFPSWMSMDNLALALPNLVELDLSDCARCQNLPILSLLPSLKRLSLSDLYGLEYIENKSYEASASSKSVVAFFASLRHLTLFGLSNVKGWWPPTGHLLDCDQQVPLPYFPRLENLMIYDCPNMTSMPLCPGVEELHLEKFNENLHIIKETDEGSISSISAAATSLRPSSSSAAPNSCCSTAPPLKRLQIDTTYYNHLPKQCLQSVTHMTISYSKDVALSKSFLQHFTEIVELNIQFCNLLEYLSAAHDDEDDQLPWKCLGRLRILRLVRLPKLATLPKGLEYLTNLEQLRIVDCDNLAELPEWIGRLSSSLQSLTIEGCPGLKSLPDGIQDLTSLRSISLRWCGSPITRRCRKPTGEDWPKIQHIPEIHVD